MTEPKWELWPENRSVIRVRDAKGNYIMVADFECGHDKDLDRAALCVRAVNSHQALVDALTEAIRVEQNHHACVPRSVLPSWIPQARAALALAEATNEKTS